jgi:D-amino-acid dehydrogenase
MPHIAVIGAGIAGVTVAYSLKERGYDVTLIDRQRYPGMETSFANGGQLSVCNAEVWNHPSTLLKGIKWMLRKDAPLLFNPAPSWHKYSWMAEFAGQIRHYRRNTIDTVRLALAARQRLLDVAMREQIAFDHESRGILHIYRQPAAFEHARRVNALLAEGGLDRRAVSADEVRSIEPTLTGALYGGFYTASDSTGDIHKFTRGLADACIRQGVRFLADAEVSALTGEDSGVTITWRASGGDGQTQTLRSDAVVIAAGVASRTFARMLGDRVNIYPVKGYSITIDLEDAASRRAAPWVSLLDDESKIVTSRLGENRLRVAGTAEFNGENRDIRDDRIRPLVAWTRRLFPGVGTEQVTPWSGLRPMMPSMLPRLGAGSRPRVFYHTGHGHLGWTLAAGTAETVAETISAALPV